MAISMTTNLLECHIKTTFQAIFFSTMICLDKDIYHISQSKAVGIPKLVLLW